MMRQKTLRLLLSITIIISVQDVISQFGKPSTEVFFEKIVLLDKYVTEGASIGDMDNDGFKDIVAGPFWWKGPDFKEKHAYAPVSYFALKGPGLEGFADNFFTFPADLDSDKYLDILRIGVPGTDSNWVKNPGKNPVLATKVIEDSLVFNSLTNVCNESPNMIDVIGDDQKELLAFSKGYLVLGIPSEKQELEWETLNISSYDTKRFSRYAHGLGAGDINGDDLVDVLERSGWWEQPHNWDRITPWRYHPYPFSPGKGGSQMFVFDVDGDGKNDVVTALNAHGYGLSWYRQVVENDSISFSENKIMTDTPEGNPYGVCFSQLHGMASGDMDKDGIADLIAGKCYYAHKGKDPGAKDPAVLYWFKTVRHANGSAEMIPYKIDDDSGVGRQVSIGDLNNDGDLDIVVGNKKGVFAFIQKKIK